VIRTSILLLALALPAAAQSNGAGEKPAAGSFSEDQASKGETVFKATCASCHATSDFTGTTFKMNWVGRTLYDYFAGVKKTMPDDNPGGLSDDEYVRVVSYILKLNGYPAGKDSLSSDSTSMKLIKIGPLSGDSAKPRTFK
jgi:mono/diheme cytochrome c family protein